MTDDVDARRAELRDNLSVVRARIDAAVATAGRPRDSVTLVAVTKTYPVSDVELLAELGVTHVGESRVQEAASKFEALGTRGDLTWHLIGQLQRNKITAASTWADVVESVDRPALVTPLAAAAAARDRRLDVLVQIDLADVEQPGRGGAWPSDVPALAAMVAAEPSLRLAGVMAVAPLGADPAAAFERLAAIHSDLLADFPDATVRSAGMSGDLEAAVAAGATHVRVGTAILGSRAPVRYGA